MKFNDNLAIMSFAELSDELSELEAKPENLERRNEIAKELEKREEERKDFNSKQDLADCYYHIKGVFEEYMDMKPYYYPVIITWIIGTYLHEQMITYPFLYFNATKGSGKTRASKLIAFFSKDGEVNNNMTEAVLFRTKGTLVIDEFEGVGRKGIENFRELCNSAYKKGAKVKRMKKKHTEQGEEQVVDTFEVFRPISMANISGMEDVLGDRCLPVYLERTTLKKIQNLMEIFEYNEENKQIKEKIAVGVHRCGVHTLPSVLKAWNDYVKTEHYTYITTPTHTYTYIHLFNKIKDMDIDGRMLELAFPLIIVADLMSEEILDEVLKSLSIILKDKKTDEFIENRDVYFIDFVSQELQTDRYITIRNLTEKFREFLQINEDWVNPKWVGLALKRLSLAKLKRRLKRGFEVVIDVEKAQEKIKIFK